MEGHWLGAMPVDKFLHTYLRTAENSALLPILAEDPFSAIPNGRAESARYNPFMSIHTFWMITAIAGWIPHLQAVDMSTMENTVHRLKLKPDVPFYNHTEGVVPPKKTDFARLELWIKFKTNSGGVAFCDPDAYHK